MWPRRRAGVAGAVGGVAPRGAGGVSCADRRRSGLATTGRGFAGSGSADARSAHDVRESRRRTLAPRPSPRPVDPFPFPLSSPSSLRSSPDLAGDLP